MHPGLESPEETHFFRWGEPFGTSRYNDIYISNKVLQKHRQLDGFTEEEFANLLEKSASRSDLTSNYMELFLRKRNNPTARWYDKTPQNVYGILLMSALYPESKFVHIYRNPLNIIASLREGKVMHIPQLDGAINYWMESMYIIEKFKEGWPDRIIELRYESFVEDPQTHVSRLLEFLGEDPGVIKVPANMIHKEKNKYLAVLSPKEVEYINDKCSRFLNSYGYK